MITAEQLREVMKFHLRNFSTDPNSVTDDTVHSTVLSDSDGFGTATSKRIYKSFIRWTLITNDHEDKSWPTNWMDLTVAQLAPELL